MLHVVVGMPRGPHTPPEPPADTREEHHSDENVILLDEGEEDMYDRDAESDSHEVDSPHSSPQHSPHNSPEHSPRHFTQHSPEHSPNEGSVKSESPSYSGI